MGGVYAETPDRIWVAMRGEPPLTRRRRAVDPVRGATSLVGNATGNTDALSATCNPNNPRGWERRFEHSIIVLDGDGNLIDEWPYLDELFSQLPCGRGPHQIKISPYDQEKHVWIIDDQLHVIYRFTYDGQLVHTLGELGVAKFDADDNFIMDWGSAPADADNPGDLDGNYLYSWGAPGLPAGRLACSHGITTDQDGNLYLLRRARAEVRADCEGRPGQAGRVREYPTGN